MRGRTFASMAAVAAMAGLAAGLGVNVAPAPSKPTGRERARRRAAASLIHAPARQDEIQQWNAQVEAKRRAKLAARNARNMGGTR